jgi:hypothetical protein
MISARKETPMNNLVLAISVLEVAAGLAVLLVVLLDHVR